ncbi:MAG: glycosyltransferase family 39 protein [Bacteroidota bacterium]
MDKLRNFIEKYPGISLVIAFQIYRLLLLPFMGLMPQDAYYYFYGENLSLSYFDHPGMIGYILRIFTALFGKTVFTLKFADFIITSFTLLSFYKLASYFLSKQKLQNAIVLIGTTIFISILSFNSTPDVPLLLFWTLTLISLYKAIFENKKIYWIWAGITMGLAFDSKYTALFLQIGLIGFLIFSKKYRKLFLSPWFWSSIIISVLVTFPVFWWNYQHDFASFLFQSSNRTGEISELNISPKNFFGAIAHQLLLLLPILFSVIVVLTLKYLKKIIFKFNLPSDKTLFLLAFFIPTFVGFFSLTFIYWVKLNWMMPSYITGIILASIFFSKKLLRTQVIISIVIHILVSLQVLFYIAPIKSDDTWVGWKELAEETQKLKKEYPDTFIFSADNYKTSAVLDFYLDEKIYAQNVIGLHAKHFDYLGDDLTVLNGKDAIFIDSDSGFKNYDKGKVKPELSKYFQEITQLEPIIIKRGNRDIRKFWIFYCTNYQSH